MAYRRYKKYEATSEDYERAKIDMRFAKRDHYEQTIGSRKKLFVKGEFCVSNNADANLDLGGLTDREFATFLAQFKKNMHRQFAKNESLFNLRVGFPSASKYKNEELYNSLPEGKVFYNVDLECAYWQMAYRLGYINDRIYSKYHPDNSDKYKKAKRYCISFLSRPSYCKYYTEGRKWEIVCDTSMYLQVYQNVRNELYKCIADVVSKVKNCIEYNIDGIFILKEDLDIVTSEFKKMNLDFKITRCVKKDNLQHQYGSKIRNFKHQLKTNQHEYAE